jgi:hypothetical protein
MALAFDIWGLGTCCRDESRGKACFQVAPDPEVSPFNTMSHRRFGEHAKRFVYLHQFADKTIYPKLHALQQISN